MPNDSSVIKSLWMVTMLAGRGRSAALRVCVNEGVKAAVMLLAEPVVTVARV